MLPPINYKSSLKGALATLMDFRGSGMGLSGVLLSGLVLRRGYDGSRFVG